MPANAQRKLRRRIHIPIPKPRPRPKPTRDKQPDAAGKQYLTDRFLRLSRFGEEDAAVFSLRPSLFTEMCNKFNKMGIKVYFQRIYILAKTSDNQVPPSPSENDNYINDFQAKINQIFELCERKKVSNQRINGFLLAMDTYTLLMIEGPDHMLGVFVTELSRLYKEYWSRAKVFSVENEIEKATFDCFNFCYSSAINTNEKFAASTSLDFDLLVYQHFKLAEKIANLTELLCLQLNEFNDQTIHNLPADPFNKALPEVQRIDLILNSNDFYMDIKQFACTYNYVPPVEDDDMVCWPMENNYTPYGIYERSVYDVNLTFSDYDKEPITDPEAIERNQKIQENIAEVTPAAETLKKTDSADF